MKNREIVNLMAVNLIYFRPMYWEWIDQWRASKLDELTLIYQALENYAEENPKIQKGLAFRQRAFGSAHP